MTDLVPIGQVLTELAEREPTRTLLTCQGQTVTAGDLERRSNRTARHYESLGAEPGDFITIGLPNSIDFYVASFATWKLGAVPQPVSPRLPASEVAKLIELAAPKLVVGIDAGGLCASVPAGCVPDDSLDDGPILPHRTAPSWKAPTSGGSTGRPKLIVSGAPGAVDPAGGAGFGLMRDGVQLVAGPLYHNAPLTFSMSGIYMGMPSVVLPRFEAQAALEAIERHRVTFAFLVPTMMHRMLRALEQHPGRFDISSLNVIWHGAAPCPEKLKAAWIDLIGGDGVFELYGGTEGQAMTVITGTEWLDRRGSVGRPVFGEMTVFDADGNPLPAGEIGEIYMRRPTGTEPTYRYIGDEVKTMRGWESIGDIGWIDEDGYVYLSDRRTDMILAGGANIYPAEVEAALLDHPAVESCAVVGLPDEDLGQRVHAVVQLSAVVDEEQLIAFLADRLVRYKIPRSIRFVDEPVRDDAGKVRRSAIRDQEIALMPG